MEYARTSELIERIEQALGLSAGTISKESKDKRCPEFYKIDQERELLHLFITLDDLKDRVAALNFVRDLVNRSRSISDEVFR